MNGERVLKVSVKGSQAGGWGLTQSFLREANYQRAADDWLAKHSKGTIFCLVEFKGVPLDSMPRMYLATPFEISEWLKAAAAGRGDTILYEEHVWSSRARATGTIDRIPSSWKFTEDRLNAIVRIVQQSGQEIAKQ